MGFSKSTIPVVKHVQVFLKIVFFFVKFQLHLLAVAGNKLIENCLQLTIKFFFFCKGQNCMNSNEVARSVHNKIDKKKTKRNIIK